jgi:hypothetical protein
MTRSDPALKKENMKNTRPGVLQYALVKAYSLTDFKEFGFSGNRYFL